MCFSFVSLTPFVGCRYNVAVKCATITPGELFLFFFITVFVSLTMRNLDDVIGTGWLFLTCSSSYRRNKDYIIVVLWIEKFIVSNLYVLATL